MEKRIMRIVWNDNNWEIPTRKKYNPKLWKDGKNNASFEKSFGFGHEDWLFNSRYEVDGYQYGYIRGVEKLTKDIEFINKVYLYTIEPINKNRLLIATIDNAEIISSNVVVQKNISPIIERFNERQIEELKAVGAYHKALYKYNFKANVRFKLADLHRLGSPNEIEVLKTEAFSRFTPYRVDDILERTLLESNFISTDFCFRKGKANPINAHTRVISIGNSFNPRTHTSISEDLYKYFYKILKIDEDFISIEKSRVYNKIIDGAIFDTKKVTFFEIKTHSSALSNIREAIGQLIEYSLPDPNIKINKLVIVGPADLKNFEREYFDRVRNSINIKLEYWAYSINEKQLIDKFKIY